MYSMIKVGSQAKEGDAHTEAYPSIARHVEETMIEKGRQSISPEHESTGGANTNLKTVYSPLNLSKEMSSKQTSPNIKKLILQSPKD